MSYRARRRRIRLGVGGALVGLLAVSAVLFWNTADNVETFSGGKADIFVAPAPHKLTRAEQNELGSVARRFVETAVARVHPERAYELIGPTMRGGLTKTEWATGEIPVVPYPVESAQWKVEYSDSEGVGLLVLVEPSQASGLRPTVFSMSMVPRTVDGKKTWLVDGWAPKGGNPTTIGASSASPTEALSGADAEVPERLSPQASRLWLLAPVFLICLVFVVPLVFFIRERRVSRKMRRYLDSRPS